MTTIFFLIDSDGNFTDINYNKKRDKIKNYIHHPSPINFDSWKKFEKESKTWYFNIKNDIKNYILPIPISFSYKRISNQRESLKVSGYRDPVLIPFNNRLFYQNLILKENFINLNENFPYPFGKKSISKLENIFNLNKNWKKQLIPISPNPYMFNDFNDFIKSYKNWYNIIINQKIEIYHPLNYSKINSFDIIKSKNSLIKLKEIKFPLLNNKFLNYSKPKNLTQLSNIICSFYDLVYKNSNKIEDINFWKFDFEISKLPHFITNDILPSNVIIDLYENGCDYQNEKDLFILERIKNIYLSSINISNNLININNLTQNQIIFIIRQSFLSNEYNLNIYLLIIDFIKEKNISFLMFLNQNLIDFFKLIVILNTYSLEPYQFYGDIIYNFFQNQHLLNDSIIFHACSVLLQRHFYICLENHFLLNKLSNSLNYLKDFLIASKSQVNILFEAFTSYINKWLNNNNNNNFSSFITLICVLILDSNSTNSLNFLYQFQPSYFEFLNNFSINNSIEFEKIVSCIINSTSKTRLIFPFFENFIKNLGIESLDSFSNQFLLFIHKLLSIDILLIESKSLDWISSLITLLNQFKNVYYQGLITYSACLFFKFKFEQLNNNDLIINLSNTLYFLNAALLSNDISPLLLQSFCTLISISESKKFLEHVIQWFLPLSNHMINSNKNISFIAWETFNYIIIKWLDILHLILKNNKTKETLTFIFKNTPLFCHIYIFHLITSLSELYVDIDSTGKFQQNNTGFIFLIAGVPVEMIELSQILKEVGFRTEESQKYLLNKIEPQEKWKNRSIISKYLKVISERNSCKQLFHLRKNHSPSK